MIPFLRPSISNEDLSACISSLKSGWLAYGKYTALAESKLSEFFGAPDFVLTSSCTASLQMSLVMANVTQGDEVITTPLSWVATANVILYVGATPIFADVDPNTGLISIEQILKKITKRTKAIIVVDLYGQMFDIKKLKQYLGSRDIKIIEDAAHSFGSKLFGTPPGTFADFTCFSFHVAKNITCGQGGGLICGQPSDFAQARLLRRDGVVGRNEHRSMIGLGYKFDATDFQSALLINQIQRYDQLGAARQAVYARYASLLGASRHWRFQARSPQSEHSGHMFVLWLSEPGLRPKLMDFLSKHGVETSVHYNPIHLEPFYRGRFGFRDGSYPSSEAIGKSAVSLPSYGGLLEQEQVYIVERIQEFYNY